MTLELGLLLALAAALLVALAARPSWTRERAGRAVAFVGLVALPAVVLAVGFHEHLEKSKATKFCTTCHVMQPYGKSLLVDDSEYVPADHYQNNLVPQDKACFTCHTSYTMYGDIQAKLKGLRHLWVYYTRSAPDTIRLYEPYQNRECLHCHGPSRAFAESDAHTEEDTTMAALRSGRMSCLTSGCHDVAHDVQRLADAPLWKAVAR
jgi:nitrate/TMAO reductase-like tetraheme cytochrome c subunit